jgi:uncharacterized coiled-coil protein SlyX
LNNIKQRATSLEKQIRLQEEEIDRLTLRTNNQTVAQLKQELKKSYDIILNLRKQVATGFDVAAYNQLMDQIA